MFDDVSYVSFPDEQICFVLTVPVLVHLAFIECTFLLLYLSIRIMVLMSHSMRQSVYYEYNSLTTILQHVAWFHFLHVPTEV